MHSFKSRIACIILYEIAHTDLNLITLHFRFDRNCSHFAIDMLMVHNGEGQSSHVPVFCVNFERYICTHITTSIRCYLHSLRYVYVPFTNISCQSNWHVYI